LEWMGNSEQIDDFLMIGVRIWGNKRNSSSFHITRKHFVTLAF
jgi:hypothetical protein